MTSRLGFQGLCQTTAMGIMPHRDVARALDMALSMDVPFWPQLPHVSFFEDMYAQTSEHFPGITIDTEAKRILFDTTAFESGLGEYMEKLADPAYLSLGPDYSVVYHRFLECDLTRYTAIRGQITGPVSFGFKIEDENLKPIIYNDTIRDILFDFIQRKVNIQHRQLKEKHPNAFVWVDEPGLGQVFSALTGYNDQLAKSDFTAFFEGLEGPKGLHLCAAVDMRYLLSLGVDILSLDAFQLEFMPAEYGQAVADFIAGGGIIAWGIVPTDSVSLGQHSPQSLDSLITGYWKVVTEATGIPVERIAEAAMLAPARCCLIDIGLADQACPVEPGQEGLSHEERLVEKAFAFVKDISHRLQEQYRLG
ncbi:MAG: hypothetical protein AB1597_02075 [Chloroflexota bacterium]